MEDGPFNTDPEGHQRDDDRRPAVVVDGELLPGQAAAFAAKFRLLRHSDAAAAAAGVLLVGGLLPVRSAVFRSLPALRCVVTTSVGVDHIDLAECRRRGIAVANAGPAFAEDVADYAVGLLLDVLRGVSADDRYVRRGRWGSDGDFPLGSRLTGKKIGILGMGNIGSEIAQRLEAFGCSISYQSRRKKPSVPYQYFSDVHDLATNCECLMVCCTLTEETRHIIDREVLLALGKGGVVINVGRGPLVNEKNLVKCLMEGEIGGAGLDVFENEPEVPLELVEMDSVVLSSHRAFLTPEAFSGLVQLCISNIEAFFGSKPLLSMVEY